LREDIYELGAAVLMMRGSERLIADTPIPRNYGSSKPVVARLPSRPAQDYRQEYRQNYRQEYGWKNGSAWNSGGNWSFNRNGITPMRPIRPPTNI
jgi:hypothetical protein